jgi:glycosyltransferase involved in cell wall biosynthesis
MSLYVVARKGIYWRAHHFSRHLARRGYQVTVMAVSPQNRFRFHVRQDKGVTIVETPDLLWGPLRSGWDMWNWLRRIVWLRNYDFDLVHAFDARPVSLLPALYLQSRRRMPLVMDWGDWFGRGGSVEERPNPVIRTVLRPVETFFEERFRTRADGTTVICSTLRDKAIALGVPPETIALLRDGADVEGLKPLDREACRHQLGLPVDAPILGYVGAIYHRDAQLMARAFDLVQDAVPSARLLLIGYFNRPVEDMVKKREAVIRTGFVSYGDMNLYLSACDVGLLPYLNSGANRGRWPMKLADYMCVGRPTVATAVGDVKRVMQKYAIGLLAQDTPEDFSLRVQELLAAPERCTHLGHNARQVAEDVFDWRLITSELETLYAKVLSGRPHIAV